MGYGRWYKTGFMGAAIAIGAFAGAGFWFTAAKWDPAATTAYITYRPTAPAVLGAETNVPSGVSEASTNKSGQTGLTPDQVDGLFQSYYQRPASLDEKSYWSGKTKEQLTALLEKFPSAKPQITEVHYVPVYTPPSSEDLPTDVAAQPFHVPTTANQ